MPWLSIALQFIAKHWRAFAIGAAALAVVIGFKLYQHRIEVAEADAENSRRERERAVIQLEMSNRSLDRLQGEMDKQNNAIADLATDGQERIREGQRAIMDEVRKGAKAQTVARELQRAPTQAPEQSKTSATVMANRDML